MDKNKRIRPSHDFNELERRAIIEEYLTGDMSKKDIWYKYTGYEHEHGGLLNWMRKLGYVEKPKYYSNFELQNSITLNTSQNDSSKEELQNEILKLKRQLEEAQIKAEGYDLMIDIAEKQFNIPIRKKPSTK